MFESTIVTCNSYSHLKTSGSRVTWHIDGFKYFIGLHKDMWSYLEEISCRFQGGLSAPGLPVKWLLFLQKDTTPRYDSSDIYLVLKREQHTPKVRATDKVFIRVNISILNSQNVNIFSKKTEMYAVQEESPIMFTVGKLDAFASAVAEGTLTVHCTIDQVVWDNVRSLREFSPVEEEINGTLVTDFKNLLDSGENADVIIKVSDGRAFNAHKAVLSARSPVFQKMFTTQMRESIHNVVELIDIGEEAMEVLLSYIYTGMLDLKGQSTQSLRELVDAADKYQLANMKDLCNESLLECCNAHNAFELLNLAKLHELKDAENEISVFIELNIANILKSTVSVTEYDWGLEVLTSALLSSAETN